MHRCRHGRVQRLTQTLIHFAKHRRGFAALLVAVALLSTSIGMGLFARYVVSPAEGLIAAVHTSFGRSSSIDMTPRMTAGHYATFAYPGSLISTPAQITTDRVVASYTWKYQDIQTWNLAVSIIDVPAGNVTDNNAYLFRKRNPERFSESHQTIHGQDVAIMTDKTANGFDQVGFLRHGRYQAVVALTGDDLSGSAALQATLAMVLQTWHWLQG